KTMQKMLAAYGQCDNAANGEEAVEAFQLAWDEDNAYDLICLDIMMPGVNGHEALEKIRALEQQRGIAAKDEVKVIMTTSLDDPKSVVSSYKEGATAYLVKPVTKEKLLFEMRRLRLIE
ncbi:MAG: response regulator, partial [Deltaproteobacteria bacterium]|nr:response regulator [Deltaproteobacteria bacterium]